VAALLITNFSQKYYQFMTNLKINKFYNLKQIQTYFWILTISFSISSCKIFRSNNTTANTHSHKVEPKSTNSTNAKIAPQAIELISLARSYTGVPYKPGGTTEEGMDCSGLLYKVCQTAGLSIPRISYQQAEIGEEIDLDDVQKGDFVFFSTAKSTNRISHVGLVTEVNPQSILFIHSSTSKGVREDNLYSDYWKKAFAKATRPFVF
jgi:probable lipoprotein NlpC